MQFRLTVLLLSFTLFIAAFAQTQGAPRAVFPEKTFNFGHIKQGEVLLHKFSIRNEGSAPLVLDKVDFQLPGLTSKFKPEIPPGAEGTIQIEVNTIHFTGEMDLEAELFSNDPAQPKFTFTLSGTIDPIIEIAPIPSAYISLYADENKHQTLQVINHEKEPLKITSIETQGTHFKADLKEVTSGQLFELTITVPAGTNPGRYDEAVILHTNQSKMPKVGIGVNLYVMQDLRANPEAVEFSGITLSLLNQQSELINSLYEVVTLEKRKGDFEIKNIQTDVPFLQITQTPDSGRSSKFRLDVQVVKDKLTVGSVSGNIRVTTDDKQFPEIVIAVTAEIK